MANILRYPKKQLEKTLKGFVKKENVDSDDISDLVRAIKDFIYEFELKSEVEDKDPVSISTSKDEQAVIEKMLYSIDGSKTSLTYVFDGNITYMED